MTSNDDNDKSNTTGSKTASFAGSGSNEEYNSMSNSGSEKGITNSGHKKDVTNSGRKTHVTNSGSKKDITSSSSEKNISKQQPELTLKKSDKKHCRLCDPTPEAYQLANQKARLRALDARDPLYSLRQIEYNRHVIAVENVKTTIDNSPPYVPKPFYHGVIRTNKSSLLQAQIEIANAKLLHGLSAIYNGSVKTGLETRLKQSSSIRNRTYERAMKTVELVHQNIQKFQSLKKTKSMYSNERMRKWYEEQQKHSERISKYPNIFKPKVCPLPFRKVMERALEHPRQYAYLLIEIEDLQAANLVIELFADMCPFTVKNFQTLCTNTKATSCDCRTYRCKKIDRLHCVQVVDGSFRKVYWVIAEFVDSTVEYTDMLLQESSPVSHTEAGLVTRPKGRSGGVFFITIGPCTHMDQFCYVFGRVTGKGMEFLKKMQEKNLEENGQPIVSMHITDCGVVDSINEVPPPMLLQDFISQVRLEIMPFLRRNPEKPGQWQGGKSTFAEHLKQRITESQQRFEEAKDEGDAIAEDFQDPDDKIGDDDYHDDY